MFLKPWSNSNKLKEKLVLLLTAVYFILVGFLGFLYFPKCIQSKCVFGHPRNRKRPSAIRRLMVHLWLCGGGGVALPI